MEEEIKKFGVAKTQTLEEYYNEENSKKWEFQLWVIADYKVGEQKILPNFIKKNSPNRKKWNWNQATNAQNYSPI